MKKRIIAFMLALTVLLSLSAAGCSNDHNTDHTKNMIKNALEIKELPSFEIIDSFSKTHSDGSIETYSIIKFEDDASKSFSNRVALTWAFAPVSTQYMNFSDYVYIIPDSGIDDAKATLTKLNGKEKIRYLFVDKTADFEKKYAFNIKEDKKKYDYTYDSTDEESFSSGKKYIYEETDPRTPYYAVGFACGFFDPDEKKLYVYSFEPAYDSKYLKYIK